MPPPADCTQESRFLLPERVPGLDALRALAIALVLICHAAMIFDAIGTSAELAREVGALGVDLFFALSGFLIGGILIDTGDRLRSRRILAGFWVGRWMRTLPNYLLFFIVDAALWRWVYASHHVPWDQAARSLIFCQNITHAPGWFYVESWSLSVEEWFYLLLPAGLWVALVCRARFRLGLALLLALMFAEPLLRRWSLPVPRDWGLDVNMVVLDKFDAVAWGVFAAWAMRAWPVIWRRFAPLFALAGCGLIFECMAFALRPGFDQLWMARTLFPLIQPFGCALLLPAAVFWRGTTVRWFGATISAGARWSYSLYLANLNICVLIVARLQPHVGSGVGARVGCLFLYLVTSISIAALVYEYFERPILGLRQRIAVCREAHQARRAPDRSCERPGFSAAIALPASVVE